MKGDKGGVFSKTPGWKSLFLLKIKIKQSSGFPSKELNAVFKHINEKNISAYPRNKKKWIDKRFKIFFAHSKEIRAKWDVVKLVRFLPNTVGGGSLGDSTTTANKIFI